MKKALLCTGILLLCISVFGSVHFDLRGSSRFAEQAPGTGALHNRSVNLQSVIIAEKTIRPGFRLYLNSTIDGTPHKTALPENKIPFTNHVACGLHYRKKHLFAVELHNDIFAYADTLSPLFYHPDTSIHRKALSGINSHFQADGKRVGVTAGTQYFRLNHDVLYDEQGITGAIDDDLWSEIDVRIRLHEHIRLGVGTTLKNDFNAYGGYDYGDHYIGAAGNYELRMKARRLYLDWRIGGHWRISEIMYLREIAQGPAAVIDIRPLVRLRNRIFVKGALSLDLSERMQKQRYALGVRKSWKNGSSVNVGCWATAGSLFPRRGADLTAPLYFDEKGTVGFVPHLQVYWRQDPGADAFRFYRTDASAEMVWRLFPHAEITGGYAWSRFVHLVPFANRGVISLGVRKW